ncbi:hypothetical protein LIA77_04359 [Sarocladium implicatum]|nr:hypothetical protein LIA77_04359 [Sarocladium implicatum]
MPACTKQCTQICACAPSGLHHPPTCSVGDSVVLLVPDQQAVQHKTRHNLLFLYKHGLAIFISRVWPVDGMTVGGLSRGYVPVDCTILRVFLGVHGCTNCGSANPRSWLHSDQRAGPSVDAVSSRPLTRCNRRCPIFSTHAGCFSVIGVDTRDPDGLRID